MLNEYGVQVAGGAKAEATPLEKALENIKRRRSSERERQKEDFKKLIESSMVREYNFSRSSIQ